MEGITNLDEATDFVKQFIAIEDLICFYSLGFSDILNAGFEEIGQAEEYDESYHSYRNQEGQLLNYFPARNTVHIYKGLTTTNIYAQNGAKLFYDIRGLDLAGTSCNLYVLMRIGSPLEITGVDLDYEGVSVDSVRRFTSVYQPFVDADDSVIRRQTTYNTLSDTVTVHYRDTRHRRHCLSGPAVIRNGKSEYYIRGNRMSKKQWLEARKNPPEVELVDEWED